MHDGILALRVVDSDVECLARLSGINLLGVHLGDVQTEHEIRLNALKVLAVAGGIFKAQMLQLLDKFLILNRNVRINLEHVRMILLRQYASALDELFHGCAVMRIANRTAAAVHQCPRHMRQVADEHGERAADCAVLVANDDCFPLPVILQVRPLLGLREMAKRVAHIKGFVFSQRIIIYKFKHFHPPDLIGTEFHTYFHYNTGTNERLCAFRHIF